MGSKTTGKGERLTLSQLASYDDLLTDALVDHVYYWTTIRKNRSKYFPSRGIREEELTSILRQHAIVEKDPAKAETEILKLGGVKRFVDRLKTVREREEFRRHLRKYINIYLPDCPFEVCTTNRYTISNYEASVVARRKIKRGDVVKYLCGIQVSMTLEEEKDLDLRRSDFSIVMSSRKKTPSLFLGPARFANHDCEPNAKLNTAGPRGMEVVAVREISEGQEITVSYGDNYFGVDNCECLCGTCEGLRRNGWASGSDHGVPAIAADSLLSENVESGSPYSLRRKRKTRSDRETMTPSMTPDIEPILPSKRRKVGLRKSTSLLSSSIETNDTIKSLHADDLPETNPSDLGGSLLTPGPDSPPRGSGISSPNASHSQSPSFSTAISMSEEVSLHLQSQPTGSNDNGHIEEMIHTEFSAQPTPPDSQTSEPSPQEVVPNNSIPLIAQAPSKSRRTRSSRKSSLAASSAPDPTINRIPGDYHLTPLLTPDASTRWTSCTICDSFFIQYDAWEGPRAACPRCERHSKLYGYQWPKTDRDGRGDTEDRVLDHRTVHRFVKREDKTRGGSLGARDGSADGAPVGKRRRGRPRSSVK
ncbi:MAG: hypothetical protein M1819_006637 [Sarea resinae]|nr:MAG: hypothetical protein M1819_006637 [Sarea resinae]